MVLSFLPEYWSDWLADNLAQSRLTWEESSWPVGMVIVLIMLIDMGSPSWQWIYLSLGLEPQLYEEEENELSTSMHALINSLLFALDWIWCDQLLQVLIDLIYQYWWTCDPNKRFPFRLFLLADSAQQERKLVQGSRPRDLAVYNNPRQEECSWPQQLEEFSLLVFLFHKKSVNWLDEAKLTIIPWAW